MKYEEMKQRTQKIDELKKELKDIEDLMVITNFWKASIRVEGKNYTQDISETALNNILPAGTVKTLALIRKSEIEKQIEELEK